MTANARLHNKAPQLTANPLRGLTAAELGRYVAGRVIEASVTHTPEYPGRFIHEIIGSIMEPLILFVIRIAALTFIAFGAVILGIRRILNTRAPQLHSLSKPDERIVERGFAHFDELDSVGADNSEKQ